MIPRNAAAVAVTAAALLALTACVSTDSAASSPAGAPRTTAATTPCAPGIDGTGITVAGGTVTGHLAPQCTAAPPYVVVSLDLFYRPDANAGSGIDGKASSTEYTDDYTAAAPCRPGLWYLGASSDFGAGTLDVQHGATATITAADCNR